MSELYSKSSKRFGDSEDRWVSRNSGEEVKEAVVTGYEPNVPLEGKNERAPERAGEGREEGEGDRGVVL